MKHFTLPVFSLGLLISGCSKIPSADDGFVSCVVANRLDSQVEWRRGYCQDERAKNFIQSMINSELNANTAIQIALLNNPKVQAVFEDLGIAQADLVEAGLLSNPVFEVEIRYPHIKGLRTNIEYLLTTSLLDAFLIPLRTKLATTEFEQTKLRVSNEILNLAFDVRQTYYELIAEQQKTMYIRSIVELASILGEISSKQISIGNINTLEFQLAQSRFLEAELELSQSLTEIVRLNEKLNRLLGLESDFSLTLPENLPEDFDYQGYDLCALESIAIEERLDIQVARLELTRFSRMLGLKDWWTYTKLQGGLAGERDPDGTNVIGPGISGELPIFNYGQAARMRIFAEFRQAQDRLAELEIKIRSEVREAHKLLMNYSKIINDYRGRLLPMQGKISASSEELYNVMGLGVDKLLENKCIEVVGFKNYTESVKKYLVSRVELDRALGGYLFKFLIQREHCQGKIE
ncbi:MAG: hypothetical protein BGO14_01320 [Chlamydiales bacterium 38-26]|nr:TolC family protein [Chlamydiales bacterium]OJV08090.1 MAG: hypothetical protein BGO14_01320 [Chlamydiales bacterium 38-26]